MAIVTVAKRFRAMAVAETGEAAIENIVAAAAFILSVAARRVLDRREPRHRAEAGETVQVCQRLQGSPFRARPLQLFSPPESGTRLVVECQRLKMADVTTSLVLDGLDLIFGPSQDSITDQAQFLWKICLLFGHHTIVLRDDEVWRCPGYGTGSFELSVPGEG